MPKTHRAATKLSFKPKDRRKIILPLPALEHYGSYTQEELEWLMAIDQERRRLDKISLSPREILNLASRLGYRKE